MVDVRPLLFINALCFMLLLTAGFARVTTDKHTSGSAVPPVYTPAETTPPPSAKQDSLAAKITAPAAVENISDDKIFADISPVQTEPSDNITDSSTIETNDTGNIQQPVDTQAEPQPPEIVTAPVFNEVEIPERPVADTIEPSKPIAEKASVGAAVAVYAKEPVSPKSNLGKLTIRSNVNGDTVLINGKPYGSTKLDVELKPGRYEIEVAKAGFVSWKGNASVLQGSAETLIARLEEYTSVEYVKGKWKGNVVTGEGSYKEADGTEYVGSFVNKLFHGVGAIKYPDGTKYSGDWFEGNMHGEGSLSMGNGDSYVGKFRENQFNGDGTLTKANGDTYSGFWVNGQLTGEGTLTTKDGLLYVGGFSENLFHGSGSLTFPDGTHYEGSFSNGKYHGKGIEIFATGKKYEGQFMDGQYHGQGEIFNPNGSKISGTFKFGKPFGKAILTTPEGEIFTARTTEPGVCYRDKSYRATQCPPMEGW
ncbi:MAG: PEGA domain-containing protein [Hahellaceae bacterium]|nr:PEGA domain-containing protein [Hahellaceae bacterium]MCP5212132.1 PEGA domain-containing protein [Hahellaceae bacterium]